MKEAIVTPVTNNIDWAQLPIIPIDTPISPTDAQATACAQICYDANALYVHLSTTEEEHRAVEQGPLGMPCEDSCLEFFFCPMEEESRYINLEFNSNGCLFLGIASCIEDLTRLVLVQKGELEELFHPVTELRSDGWDLTFQMPYTFIRRFFPDFAATPGRTMRANFYKCAEKVAKPHFLAWNPIFRQGRSRFHTPAEFGQLHFE